jgi:hypothetical protein
MRLAKLQNFKFSDLNFYHYFFTAYIGLHVTFSLLLGNITAFAPDENVYKSILTRLYTSGFTSDVLGFGGAWEPWLRLVYLPAKLLTYLGLSDLIAARILAITYSALATYLLVKIAKANGRDDRVFKVAIIVISFIPTVFLWSSIGLRESFLYLEISVILYGYSKLKSGIDVRNTLLLGFAIFSLAMTKNYIYILFLFATLITLFMFTYINRRNFLNHLLVLSLTLLPLAVNPTLIPAIGSFILGQVSKEERVEVGDINNDGSCDSFEPCLNGNDDEDPIRLVATGGMTVHALLSQLEGSPNSLVARLANGLGITQELRSISTNAIVLETDKQVERNQKQLSLQQAGLKKPGQVLKSTAKFLLVPFMFIDNGSLFLNIQSIETPLWLFIYLLFFLGLYQLIRHRREIDYAVAMATLFAFEFMVISALTEINIGTALRHRSLLLIPILVIWLAKEKRPASI